MTDYTRGEDYIITQRETVGERSNAVRFLLPDGSRVGVIVDQAFHTPEIERKLGDALASGRINRTKADR